MSVDLALELRDRLGWKVFPVKHTEKNEKIPLTPHAYKDATDDPNIIMEWWEKHPDAKVGVPAGMNGIVILDVDTKNGVDGFDSIDRAWLDIPETFAYDTSTGGRHFVYRAPEDVPLTLSTNYRGLEGVDIRAGGSWAMWVGEVPREEDITDAPTWICDPAEERKAFEFEGDLQDWFEKLVPGEPNILVRRAIDRLSDDMSHSEMIAAQHSAIRLGSEGNPGVPELLEALEDLWLNRPPENHTTPESEWGYKFQEGLQSGLEKYGALTEQLENLPDYHIGLVPPSVPTALVTNKGSGASGFSKLLGALVKESDDNDRIASILWGAPATQEISREWGLQFVHRRIEEARVRPEPTRENPRIEAEIQRKPVKDENLLTGEEQDYLATRPTYVDHVIQTAKDMKYDQFPYFRAIGWVTAAMAFSFKGFIPMSPTHKMGLNLWFINPGYSGTGKSVASGFRDNILKVIFSGDPEDIVPFDLGDDSSPQGLHTALLERDRRAAIFSSDEAAGFFATLGLRDWKTGLEEKLTSWYNGYVQGSNKLTQKELRGKSAITSLNMHMVGTPDKLETVIQAEMFETGFMARVCWAFGNPPREDESRFNIRIDRSGGDADFFAIPKPLQDHGVDLVTAVIHREKPVALGAAPGVEERISETYKRMYLLSEGRENWDLIEPSLTRLSETLLKMAGISALYRGDHIIRMDDALQATKAMEEYFDNLHKIVARVSAGEFQRRVDEIDAWIRSKGGTATRSSIFYRFKNFVERDAREIDNLLTYLIESGSLNRIEENNTVKYEINGGI